MRERMLEQSPAQRRWPSQGGAHVWRPTLVLAQHCNKGKSTEAANPTQGCVPHTTIAPTHEQDDLENRWQATFAGSSGQAHAEVTIYHQWYFESTDRC